MTRTPRLLIGAAISSMMLAAPYVAVAQNPRACAPREALVDKLGNDFGEAVTAEGVDDAGNLVQVFTSENGTWTIAVTLPGGPSCVVSSGEGWSNQQLAQVPKPAPRPDWAS